MRFGCDILTLFVRGNKTMKKILILSILLTGCSTAYQPHALLGQQGFAETQLSQNHFKVTFKGNEKTSQERASDFALLRASELMIAGGCTNFKVLNSANENIGSLAFPQSHKVNAFTSSIENRILGNNDSSSKLYSPKSTIEVGCATEGTSAESKIYASASVNESIKHKYQIGIK